MERTLSQEQIKEIQRLIEVDGQSAESAANAMGLPSATIRQRLLKSGYKIKRSWRLEPITVVSIAQ